MIQQKKWKRQLKVIQVSMKVTHINKLYNLIYKTSKWFLKSWTNNEEPLRVVVL